MIARGERRREDFAPSNEIIAHPIPFDLHTLRALKRSSLGLRHRV